MGLLEYVRVWIKKKDISTSLSLIKASLNELEKSEVLSRHGKELVVTATENAHRLEILLFRKSRKSFQEKFHLPNLIAHVTDNQNTKETLLIVGNTIDLPADFQQNLREDYHLIHIEDGNEAIKLANEINPDIVIADALLSAFNGYELCRMLKSSIGTSHIPVILLSALNEKENIIYGLEAGANDFIVKPFDFDILKARLRNILQSREQLRRSVFTDVPAETANYTNELDIAFLDKAKEIVESEIDNPEFSINEFCGRMAMSRTSVYNKLKTLTGQSPNDFIRIIRLNKAKTLLASKKFTVSEVAYKVGFIDSKYFSTSFKKQFGISPSKM